MKRVVAFVIGQRLGGELVLMPEMYHGNGWIPADAFEATGDRRVWQFAHHAQARSVLQEFDRFGAMEIWRVVRATP